MSSLFVTLYLLTVFVYALTRRTNNFQQTDTEIVDCNGNCVCTSSALLTNATCILNCDGKDQCKDSTLTCSTGIACIINCIGENACGGNGKLNATGATDVSITCNGTDACKGNTIIDCGTGDCTILCDSITSCLDATVYANNAKSLKCIGECDSFAFIPASFTSATDPPQSSTLSHIVYINNVSIISVTETNPLSDVNVTEDSDENLFGNMSPISSDLMWYIVIASVGIIGVLCSVMFCRQMFCKGNETDTVGEKATDSVPNIPKRPPPTKSTITLPKLPPRRTGSRNTDENEMKIAVENEN